jgi:hypothetical protein
VKECVAPDRKRDVRTQKFARVEVLEGRVFRKGRETYRLLEEGEVEVVVVVVVVEERREGRRRTKFEAQSQSECVFPIGKALTFHFTKARKDN